jgi:hypothetical protein
VNEFLALSAAAALVASVAPSAYAQQSASTPGARIALTSPLDYQVFQRKTKFMGAIVVRGSLSLPADELDVQTQGESSTGSLPGNWQKIALSARSGTFDARIPTPAGGFYLVSVLAKKHPSLMWESARSLSSAGNRTQRTTARPGR